MKRAINVCGIQAVDNRPVTSKVKGMSSLRREEIEAVSLLPRDGRLDYFIKRSIDQEIVWGLQSDGWVVAGNASGLEIFQVWPSKEYAERCHEEAWYL